MRVRKTAGQSMLRFISIVSVLHTAEPERKQSRGALELPHKGNERTLVHLFCAVCALSLPFSIHAFCNLAAFVMM